MNKLALSIVLSTFALAAQAQSPTPAPAAEQTTGDAADATEISGAQAGQDNCLQQTGTRIVSKDKNACINAAGKSYSQKDIRRTGATDVGDALRLMDPSIQIHH